MSHENLTIAQDQQLIEKILDDKNMRYIVLFLYVIRNDLFHDLSDKSIIKSYERVLILDDIHKGNIESFWDQEFTRIALELGLLKNIRTYREYQQKDDDFIVKLGEETVTIEEQTILVPKDTLFAMIKKKFSFLTKRNFNSALVRLKGVRCERGAGIIHPFIYEIGGNDVTLADDLYYILDQYGNIYQAIKIEVTIERFYEKFKKMHNKLLELIEIYDEKLTRSSSVTEIENALDQGKDILKHLEEEGLELPDKFKFRGSEEGEIYQEWKSTLIKLFEYQIEMSDIDSQLMEIKQYYSGTDKKYGYLEFIEKVSFNEDNIVTEIENLLIKLRERLIKIKEVLSAFTKKKIKLLNLDLERYILTNED
ncbi:MAG: hypothetical protein R6U96_12190 [Promethearchaeia archaeon]